MRIRANMIIQPFLAVVLVVCLVNFVVKKIDIAKKDEEIGTVTKQILDQKLKNGESEDILSDENKDDFYRKEAEENLGYADRDEIVYQLVPRS